MILVEDPECRAAALINQLQTFLLTTSRSYSESALKAGRKVVYQLSREVTEGDKSNLTAAMKQLSLNREKYPHGVLIVTEDFTTVDWTAVGKDACIGAAGGVAVSAVALGVKFAVWKSSAAGVAALAAAAKAAAVTGGKAYACMVFLKGVPVWGWIVMGVGVVVAGKTVTLACAVKPHWHEGGVTVPKR